jgi:hypothetical protein
MMSQEMVVAKIFTSELDAEIAREQLETAGIPARIVKDDAGGMLPSLQAPEGVKLFVAPSDLEEAQKILESMN